MGVWISRETTTLRVKCEPFIPPFFVLGVRVCTWWNCGCDGLEVLWSNYQIWKVIYVTTINDDFLNKSKFSHRISKPSQPHFGHMEIHTPSTKNGGANGENSKLGRYLKVVVSLVHFGGGAVEGVDVEESGWRVRSLGWVPSRLGTK